jgi:hypothetical protein
LQATELEVGKSFITNFLAQCKAGGQGDCTLSLLSTAKLPALDKAIAALAKALLAAVKGTDKAKVAGGEGDGRRGRGGKKGGRGKGVDVAGGARRKDLPRMDSSPQP